MKQGLQESRCSNSLSCYDLNWEQASGADSAMPHRGQKGPESGLISSLTCAENVPFAKQFLPLPIQDRMNRSCRGNRRGNPASIGPTERVPVAPSDAPSLAAESGFRAEQECREQALSHCSGRGYAGSQFPLLLPQNKNRCSSQPQMFSCDSGTLSR